MRAALLAALALLTAAPAMAAAPADPLAAAVEAGLARTGARGIAVATAEGGRVTALRTWGARNAAGDPLTPDTIMYAASITKPLFALTVLLLAEEGRIDLDRPIAAMLPRPLPDYPAAETEPYADYTGLAGDARWRRITPRMLLAHTAGFHNFGFMEADGRLRIHFEPGSRYSYSGDGMILLQFVLERGLGLDVGAEMRRRLFDPLGMTRSSMRWRPDFAADLADGWTETGKAVPHDRRSRVRAAGSLDASAADLARFVAAFSARGGRYARARRAMLTPGPAIDSASQFPVLQPPLPSGERWRGLAAGLGLVTFEGPQGRGFFKGGHNDSTGNLLLCVERRRRCLLILSNDVRAEATFPAIAKAALGETGMPWRWEYGWMR